MGRRIGSVNLRDTDGNQGGKGEADAVYWTCDMTHDFITINSASPYLLGTTRSYMRERERVHLPSALVAATPRITQHIYHP
jgi:hypothetical protein